MDHRWGVRIAIDTPVLLVYPANGTGPGRMIEVSTSGGFVRTRFAPPDLVCINIAGEFEEIEAYVVRHGPHGIAVEWSELLPPPICALLAPRTIYAQ